MTTKSITTFQTEVQVTVSNVSELEDALAKKSSYIFIENGDYNLSQQITLYDGMYIKGESVPTEGYNTRLDGVRLLYDGRMFLSPTSTILYTETNALSANPPEREDRYVTLNNPVGVDIPAGSLLLIGYFTYEVQRDVLPTATTIFIHHHIAVDTFSGNETVTIRTIAVRDVHVENIMYSGNGDFVDKLDYVKNLNFTNVHIDENCRGGWGSIEYCINASFKQCSANDDEDYNLYLENSNGVYIDTFYRAGYGSYNSGFMDSRYNIGGYIKNCRGSGFRVVTCYEFEVDNCHTGGNTNDDYIYISNSKYFSVINCSSTSSNRGFNMYNCDHFMVTGCSSDAPEPIQLTLSSNYQVFGNHWQGDFMKVKLIDYNINPKNEPYIAQINDINTKFLTTEQKTGVIIDSAIFPNGAGSVEGVMEFHGDRGYVYSNILGLFRTEHPNVTYQYWPDYNSTPTTTTAPSALPPDDGYHQARFVTSTNTVWEINGVAGNVGWVDTLKSIAVYVLEYFRISIQGYTGLYRWTLGDGQHIATRKSNDDWYRYGENVPPSVSYRNMPKAKNNVDWIATGMSPLTFSPSSLLHLQGVEGMDQDVFRIDQPTTKGGNKIFGCRARGNFAFTNYSDDTAMEITQNDSYGKTLSLRQNGRGSGINYYQYADGVCSQPVFYAYVGHHTTGSYTGDFLRFYNDNIEKFIVDSEGNTTTGDLSASNGRVLADNITSLTTLLTPSLTGSPSNPTGGQIYWDNTIEMLYCYTNATSGWMSLL